MYERSAATYDLMNAARGKDYAAEAAYLHAIVDERRPGAQSLLDVACGTGRHLVEFDLRFDQVAGLEWAPAMRDMACGVVGGIEIHGGDMRSFELTRTFDVITCLFSSIGYMLSSTDLHAAVSAMAGHLEPDGLLLVEPWFQPDDWVDGRVVAESANSADLAVARVSHSARSGTISTFERHCTVGGRTGVESWVDMHQMALWTLDEYSEAFTNAGLLMDHDPVGPTGRGLLIGQASN